jgi:hypothetical protein
MCSKEKLEERIKEIDKSIVDMQQRGQQIQTETQKLVNQRQEEVNKLTTAILQNQGRKHELLKIIKEDFNGEEKEVARPG